MPTENFSFKCPSKTGSGFRALEQLPSDLKSVNALKPLILTDRYHSEKHIKTITGAFSCSDYKPGLYDDINWDSSFDKIDEISELIVKNGFDSIIVLGYGRVVDIAKAVNIAVSNNIKSSETIDEKEIKSNLLPFVLIPVLKADCYESSSRIKIDERIIVSEKVMPDFVCIDERIIDEESPVNVIDAALKALTTASEAYTESPNPLGGAYSHLAIEFVMKNLKDVVIESLKEKKKFKWNGKDSAKKRVALVNASVMAGYLYSNKKEGISEVLGRVVKKRTKIGEGTAMGIILPYSLEYKVYRKDYELENYMLPVAGLDTYCNTPKGQRFESAVGKIRFLINELYSLTSTQIPRTLEDAGIDETILSEMAKEASGENLHESSCFFILENAFKGTPVTP